MADAGRNAILRSSIVAYGIAYAPAAITYRTVSARSLTAVPVYGLIEVGDQLTG